MVFSSTVFLFLFLPLVLAGHLLLPRRARNAWLLATSLLFYAWGEKELVLLMVASILVNFGAGLLVERWRGTPRARLAVALAVVLDIGLLVAFKYLGFLVANLSALSVAWGGPALTVPHIPLPIGISFFTFQALSYVLDVYRGHAPVQRRPTAFGMYIALFPQLVAGPIVRYQTIAAQLTERRVTLQGFARGVRRFVVGLAKKLLVADTVALAADAVFGADTGLLTAGSAWLGVLAYTAQIYFDFSGYSDMAIGLGLMLGFDFPENFHHPYVSRSITEFWRRWHVSLSTWFRDYLYIPLGGNRHGALKTGRNLVLVFLLCGLWHGDAWTFLAWGAFHGALLVLERLLPGLRLPGLLAHGLTLLAVMVGWVLFRSDDLGQAGSVLAAMAGRGTGDGVALPLGQLARGDVLLALLAAVVGSAPLVPWLGRRLGGWAERQRSGAGRALPRALAFAAVLLLMLLCGIELAGSSSHPFIYFRF